MAQQKSTQGSGLPTRINTRGSGARGLYIITPWGGGISANVIRGKNIKRRKEKGGGECKRKRKEERKKKKERKREREM